MKKYELRFKKSRNSKEVLTKIGMANDESHLMASIVRVYPNALIIGCKAID